VLGVKHAQEVHGLKRFAIIDWDVHHGNSAETAFYDDPNVLTISVHQDNLFPTGRGKLEETGKGHGQGANLNIPLPPGSGSGAYRTVFDELVTPKIRKFTPELIFVASGFDASAMDPLGHMMLSSEDYAYMASALTKVADEVCDGRLVMTHEGGYSSAYVPYCGLAVLEALSGANSGIEDPFVKHIKSYGGQPLQPNQRQLINEVKELHKHSSH
jgi:acetoin utilization deacetylase AcuC-like enzyme